MPNIPKHLIIDQFIAIISVSKTPFVITIFMFPNPFFQIAGDTNIEDGVMGISHEVDEAVQL